MTSEIPFAISSVQFKEAMASAMLAAVDLQLLRADAIAFLSRKGCSPISVYSFIQSVSHASLKVVKNPAIEMGSFPSKKYNFFFNLPFSTILIV